MSKPREWLIQIKDDKVLGCRNLQMGAENIIVIEKSAYDRLRAQLEASQKRVKELEDALKEINREELSSQRPGGGYSRSATISYNALAKKETR